MTQSARKATADDLRAVYGEDGRGEVIHGEVLDKAMSRYEHSTAQGSVLGMLGRRFHRRAAGRWPGGWLLLPELHVQYDTHEIYCHDACGYRRDRVAEIPKSWPVTVRPDWVCEILSPMHEKRDLVDKWRVLHAAGVPHYWIIAAEEKVLKIYRWAAEGYVCALSATSGETVRAEPFDAVELRVGVPFGDEDDDE